MKTYWLDKRENRPPLARVTPSNMQTLDFSNGPTSAEKKSIGSASDRRVSLSQNIVMRRESVVGATNDRQVYSPVTFSDVARRSIANSPVKTLFSASSRGRGKKITNHNDLYH